MKKDANAIRKEVIAELVEKRYSIDPEKVEPIIADFAMVQIAGFETLYRSPFGSNGDRFYFTATDRGFFTGYSSWTERVVWEDKKFLRQWEHDNGLERAQMLSTAAREYGSLLHLIIAMHENPNTDFKFRFNDPWWIDVAVEVAKANILPMSFVEQWAYQLKNDMAAYFLWKKECKVKILAVEVPLLVRDFMVATPGDLVCEMEIMVNDAPGKKKYPKTVIAGIDIKSGDKGVGFPKYRVQLEFIRYAWNQKFKGTMYEMTHIYNWRPSSRSGRPGNYVLTDQSGYYSTAQIKILGRMNKVMGYNIPTGGVVEYFDGENSEQFNSRSMSPMEWLREWQKSLK